MFVADLLTTWSEAVTACFDADHPNEELRNVPVLLDYPMQEINYPGIWLNFTMQGELMNVGIGHVEHEENLDGTLKRYFRWHFGGVIEITIGAMSNLERARLLDSISTSIAIARVDENAEGDLRKAIDQSDLIGQIVTWESMTVSGFGETQGTPWGTDDVIYEATVSLALEGEVVLDPDTAVLVPLRGIIYDDPVTDPVDLPTPGMDGWV